MQTDPLDHRKSPQRLPVNPRRNKVPPEQRKRVATACNSCNVRRTKCSGQSPCSQCIASSRECIYPVITPKVTISRTELEELRRRVEAYDKVLQDVVPDAEKRSELLHQLGRGRGSTPTTSPASQQQLLSSSPGRTEGTATTEEEQGSTLPVGSRLLHDSLGTARFQGETSEMALADNLKTLFRELGPSNDAGMLSSIGTCYTTDIKPAPFLEVDPLRLPPQSTISTILAVLRTFLQDGSNKPEGSLPSGGIFWWGDLRSVPAPPQVTGQVELDTRNARRLAFYNTALAVACQIVSTRPATQPDHSQVFFSRATLLVGNALDMSRCSVGGVSVLTLMAYYLLETDRREAAAHYVGLAVRMSMSLGLHRGCGDERGKRIFWTLYLMDRWLSYLLGRPANLPDEAIQLPLPAEAHAMPPVTGIRAHIELARISDHIVCNIYRVAPQRDSPDSYALNLERAAFMLDQWLSDLPPALQLGSGAASTDDPSVCMLHMYHNQLLVLAYRPCLLAAVRGAASQSPVSEVNAAHIEQCLRAAERNMGLARHVATLHQPRRLLHAGLHHVFSAALCFLLLEVYRVLGDGRLGSGAEDAARSSREIDFAIELFRREAHAGNAYGRACVRTLRELKAALGRVGRSRRGSMDMDVDQALQGLQRAASWQTHMSSEDGDGSSSSQQLQQQQQGRPVMGMLGEETLYSDVLSWMGEDWPAIE